MFKKISATGVLLTRELAREWAAMTPLPGEREIRPARHEFLLAKVRNQTFGGPSWACGVERSTGKKYRLDGQHSSKMLQDLPPDVAFPKDLLVTIDTWEFDSLDQDASVMFNMYNHPKSVRSNQDAMGVYLAQAQETSDLDRSLSVKITSGIAEFEKTLDPKEAFLPQPRDRGLYFLGKKADVYTAFARWVATLEGLKNGGFLSRPAVVGEMLNHWLKDRSSAEEFWGLVLRENHPEVDHETRTLAETFRGWLAQRRYRGSQYKAKAATAWRHYLRERRAEEQEAREAATARETTLAPPPAVSRGSESVNTL